MGNTYRAKGDLESAINLVDEEILKEEWNDNEKKCVLRALV